MTPSLCVDFHADATRAVKDDLARLDDASFGAASEVRPKLVSPFRSGDALDRPRCADPAFFDYANNYLIDTDHAIIVNVEATRAVRQAEVGAARTMIDHAADRFGLRLAGDSAYGAAPMLAWLVKDTAISPHVPVFDRFKRDDGTLCPQGKSLRTTGSGSRQQEAALRVTKTDCDLCPLKLKCCPNTPRPV